jgi:hypothetical protein
MGVTEINEAVEPITRVGRAVDREIFTVSVPGYSPINIDTGE